ncbi:MAG TPA: recombinase family protein [Dehalococcoidia bacterium]|nr:recombinase family protein [Dehalococcoidia bacterium]
MKVALYARVSTDDKNQDPETQLLQLCDYCQRQEWDVHDEYQDHAPAGDQLKASIDQVSTQIGEILDPSSG